MGCKYYYNNINWWILDTTCRVKVSVRSELDAVWFVFGDGRLRREQGGRSGRGAMEMVLVDGYVGRGHVLVMMVQVGRLQRLHGAPRGGGRLLDRGMGVRDGGVGRGGGRVTGCSGGGGGRVGGDGRGGGGVGGGGKHVYGERVLVRRQH